MRNDLDTSLLQAVPSSMQQARKPLAALALNSQRDLLDQFVQAADIDLSANPAASAILAQLQSLSDDIYAHTNAACGELNSVCEGLEMFVELLGIAHTESLSASNLRGLLAPLHRQLDDAASAVTNLL